MGFKPTRYFQNVQNPSDVMPCTLDTKIMKAKGWKQISYEQYIRIQYGR